MARLIDANELKQRILEERDKIPLTLPGAIYELRIAKTNHFGNAMRGGIRKALRCMEQCKTVDAVPVVRCKDCKHWDCGVCDLHSEKPDEYSTGLEIEMFADDFCSYGERKDND